MKRVKKWVALLLTAVMVMSMAGCGQTSGNEGSSKSGLQSSTPDSSVAQPSSSDTEDEKPYKGLHLKIWGFYDFATTVESDIAVYRAEEPLFHAINEWCLENECTWEWVKYDIPDTNLLLSAVASGNGPDLLYTYNHFPWGVTTGMLEPLDEYYDDFAETFSSFNWEDYALVSDGSFYGTIIPWGAHRVIQYDRTLFEELGVKTPMEYFMEGNWNWETFQTTLQDITKDTNGDGVLDTRGISLARLSSTFLNEVKLEEDGSISSTLNSERSRAFYNMIYEEYSVTGSIIPGWEQIGNGNAYYATGAVPCYTAMYTSNIMHYDVSQLLYADANGRVLETVPVPEWKSGDDPEYFGCTNECALHVGKNAQNVEASMDLLKYIIECVMVEVEKESGGLVDAGDLTGLKGTTDSSAEYLTREAKYREEKVAATKALPEYDQKNIDAVISFFAKNRKQACAAYDGVSTALTQNDAWNTLWTTPAATSIAEAYERHKSECEQYNTKFVR